MDAVVYDQVEGFIVGSYFKQDGWADNLVDEVRVKRFTEAMATVAEARRACLTGGQKR